MIPPSTIARFTGQRGRGLSRREQNYQQTRRRLVEAARHLFERDGYDAVTVETLAAAAGVSPRTVYRYFDTKGGLVAEPIRRIVDHVMARADPQWSIADIADAFATAAEEAIASGDLEWSLWLYREHPALVEETPVWRQHMATDLAIGLARARGAGRPDRRDRIRAGVAIQIAALAADEWIARQPRDSYRQLVHEVIRTVSEDLDLIDR